MKIIFTTLALASIMSASAQTLTSTGSLITARWQHESLLLPSGKVLTFGGDDCSTANTVYASSELYNAGTGTWSSTGAMMEQRTHFSSVVLQNGKVLAIGGYDSNQDKTATCELYNETTGLWTVTGSMVTARDGHRSVLLPNGKVLVSGGVSDMSVEIYDPATETWSAAANSNYTHGKDGAMIVLNNGKVLFTGGESASPANRAEIYDPATDSWSWTGSMQMNRSNHGMCQLADGRILIYGGSFSPMQTEIFDPANNSFTLSGAPSKNRSNSPSLLLTDGRVLVYSLGDFFNPTNTKLIETFNPATGTWSAITSNLIGANLTKMVRLQNASILVIGGSFTTGNGASAVCRIIQGVSAAGIEEEQSEIDFFSVFPNPASKTIQIKLGEGHVEIDRIEISSINGQVIQSIAQPETTVLDINEFSAGVYFMKAYAGQNQQTVKFIVE